METFLILLAFGVLGLLVWLPIYVLLLGSRLRKLTARLAVLETMRPATAPVAAPAPPPEELQAEPLAAAAAPWQPPPRREPDPADQNRPLVVSSGNARAATAWLARNWVYVVSALSLALAAIFLLQYGVEHGLLPPAARVAAAILLGLALVAAGEWLRRRHGDGALQVTAYLPSTFSGAGIVALFASVVAARQMYGLIGPELALAGLIAVAAFSLVLGWLYGPWLAAVGLVGAAAAPFLVGGGSETTWWLYPYFALVAATGLAIDAGRRWAWVSVLALVLGYAGGALVLADSAEAGLFAAELVALVALALTVPMLNLMPAHTGTTSLARLLRRSGDWPGFPTRLVAGTTLAASLTLALLGTETAAESLFVYAALAALVLALAVWAKDAPALADLTALPALGFLARLGLESLGGALYSDFTASAIVLRTPESTPPVTATVLLALALAGTLAAAWRSLRATDHTAGLFWAGGAALFAPLAALALELGWAPARVIGPELWALHVIALAALMVWLAVLYARADGQSRRRAALATLSALSLIAFALFIVLTETALTLALSVLVVVAAGLDRRFRLPEMGYFLQAGVLVLGYRLLADPGLDWAMIAPVWEVVLAFVSASAALTAAQLLLSGTERARLGVILESGTLAFAAVLADVLVLRWLERGFAGNAEQTHWGAALMALPWLVVAFAALWRLQLGGPLALLRKVFALVTGLIGLGSLAVAVTALSPLARWSSPLNTVSGPMLLDTLTLAYLLPAALFFAAARRMRHLGPRACTLFYALSGALAVLWLGLEIRRFWVGNDLSVRGVSQGELISYTVAMVLAAAALLYQAIALGSALLRRLAMAVVVLTVAKVFLIDAAGLTGLTRVASFLGLGLALAGSAWLNRWAAARARSPSA